MQFASIAFDASMLEIGMTFAAGATLCLVARQLTLPGPELVQAIRSNEVTHLFSAPAAWELMPDEDLPTLEVLIFGGEALPQSLVDVWAKRCRVINIYGPTETTINVLYANCHAGERVPLLGKPTANTKVHLLDGSLREVPVGVPGEICIRGLGVAAGYRGRPDLTAERFIADPFGAPGDRMYRSGDLAFRHSDGSIEYLGRNDEQVKIRGYRIELSEIEAKLRRLGEVREAAVVVMEHEGDKHLVAFVVRQDEISSDGVRRRLRGTLPPYMVPSRVVFLDELPLNRNGKVDRKQLPSPFTAGDEISRSLTPMEERVAKIWQELTGIAPQSAEESFFDAGGHSLLAVRLVAALRDKLGVELPLAVLFEEPTLAAIARVMEEESSSAATGVTLLRRGSRGALYLIAAAGGDLMAYRDLIAAWSGEESLYGLSAPEGEAWSSIEELATVHADRLAALASIEPLQLAGWSFGGVVAFEVARQLRARGVAVDRVTLLDSYPLTGIEQRTEALVTLMAADFDLDPLAVMSERSADSIPAKFDRLLSARGRSDRSTVERLWSNYRRSTAALSQWQPQQTDVTIVHVAASQSVEQGHDPNVWRAVSSHLDVKKIDGEHHAMIRSGLAQEVTRLMV